jgi:broad specificity phosphatase PhoE
VGLDVLYGSPLRRAFQTASVVADALDLPLHEDARLMEIHQGEWQGVLHADIKTRYAAVFDRWVKEPWTVTLPGGESLAQVQTRVHAALDAIVKRHPGQCVGLVTHRIPITLVKIRYQGLDPDAVRTLELPNTYWEEIQVPERGGSPLHVEFDGNPGLR